MGCSPIDTFPNLARDLPLGLATSKSSSRVGRFSICPHREKLPRRAARLRTFCVRKADIMSLFGKGQGLDGDLTSTGARCIASRARGQVHCHCLATRRGQNHALSSVRHRGHDHPWRITLAAGRHSHCRRWLTGAVRLSFRQQLCGSAPSSAARTQERHRHSDLCTLIQLYAARLCSTCFQHLCPGHLFRARP